MYRDTAMPQVCVWVVYDCLCACWHDWVAVTAYLAAELKTLGCGPALPRKCTLTCDLASVRGSLHAVMIAPDCHPPPPRLTAELLRLLCAEPQVKEQVKLYEGVPVLLSLLHSDHLKLLWSVVWILVQVCEDPETSVEIRIWGGIKQLLHILRG